MRVNCPECGYSVGLGVASEPGRCPSCDVALMLAVEMRSIDAGRAEGDGNGRSGARSRLTL